MKKIKILQFNDSYYPKVDGPNTVVTNYAKCLNKMDGVVAEVVVPATKNYVDEQPFVVHRVKSIKGPEGYNVATTFRDRAIKKYIKENNIDLIHVHSPFVMLRFAEKLGKKYNIPVVYTFHTAFKEDFERTFKSKFMVNRAMGYIMKGINRADKVLTVSDGAKNVLLSYGCTKPIQVIRNGTEFDFPQNAAELVSEVNRVYKLENEKFVMLSVGRVVSNKSLDLAIDALKIVSDKGYNFKYVIVGDGNYKTTLEEKVKALNLEDKIMFTGRVMGNEMLKAFYLRSDLFIFPSTFDTASLAPIEAAAMKLPTLMTKGCSTAEIITENQNGFLAEHNAEAWAEKIIEILDNPAALTAVKENAFTQVYRKWDSVVEEVFEIYKTLINKEE